MLPTLRKCETIVDPNQPTLSDIFPVIDPTKNMDVTSGACRVFPDRKKRKRSRISKNREEAEYQRMTHIAIERNRRKRMNEYLKMLRSLVPSPYVQSVHQASIIEGTAEFVKQLEHILNFLQTQKSILCCTLSSFNRTQSDETPFRSDDISKPFQHTFAELRSTVVEVQVKMSGSHAFVMILSQKKPGRLLRIIAAIESLCLMIMCLNITTKEHMVHYSINVQVGMHCKLETCEELACSVHNILGMIEESSK